MAGALTLSVVSCACTACDRFPLTGRKGEEAARMPRVGAPEGQTRGAARPLSLSVQRHAPRRSRIMTVDGNRSAKRGGRQLFYSLVGPKWAAGGVKV